MGVGGRGEGCDQKAESKVTAKEQRQEAIAGANLKANDTYSGLAATALSQASFT